LQTVVTIRRIIQPAGLVDDAHAGLLGFYHDTRDVIATFAYHRMQLQSRFNGCLGVKFGRKGHLEEDITSL